MSGSTALRRYDYYLLLAFAFTAVASIALQNLVWVSILLFLFFSYRNRQKIHWPSNLFTIATIIFLETFFMGAVMGINPEHSAETVHKYLTILILFPIGAMALSLNDIRKYFHFFIGGATVCAIYGIGKHFIQHEDRIDSFSGDKMVFGGMLMVSLLLNITLLKQKPKNYWLYPSLALIFTALILTETRGAWVGALCGIVLLFWYLDKKWVIGCFLALLIGYFLVPKELQERVQSVGSIHFVYNADGSVQNASQSRFLIWIAGWNIIKDYPMGVGQGNIETIYPKYRIQNPYSEQTVPHLHDTLLQLLAQNGWAGLAAYLFWIFAFYWMALRFKGVNVEADEWNWMFLSIFTAIFIWGLTEYTFSQQFTNIEFSFLGIATILWIRHAKSKTN